MDKSKSILSLSADEVMNTLMTSDMYETFELPEYFKFDSVLAYVRDTIGERPYSECIAPNADAQNLNVNFDILLNKDGRYAVRPLILCNPYLYYFAVRELCGGDRWQQIKAYFDHCTVPHITSNAMPVVKSQKEPFHASTIILNWWNTMEQRSIELSLEYKYMFLTDISNCYGSIDPDTIANALTLRGTQQENTTLAETAVNLRCILKDMQRGRNVGIPQGSTLFDIIGEIVLAYADLLLHEKMQQAGITQGYEILRYRDDYHIFCNSRDTMVRISYLLQEVLEGLNLRMNAQKTRISDSIITDSVKPDKLYYIENTPITNRSGCDFDGLQKHLLFILLFARKHPDSGQVKVMLSKLDQRIVERIENEKKAQQEWEEHQKLEAAICEENDKLEENTFCIIPAFTSQYKGLPKGIRENIRAMSAIALQIAVENVGACHYALRIISYIDNNDEKAFIIQSVYNRISEMPNSTYNIVWLQNMTYNMDIKNGECPYRPTLCRVVAGESEQLWDNSWLRPELTKDFPLSSVVDRETLAQNNGVIIFRERRNYETLYDADEAALADD